METKIMKKLFAVITTLAGLFAATQAFAADIEIRDAWAKASLGKVPNGAAFLTVENTGMADRIVGVKSELADKTELHTHIMDNNVMKMRPVEGGIDVPMHGEVMFKPGSYHIMLIGLHKPLEDFLRQGKDEATSLAGGYQMLEQILAGSNSPGTGN